MKLTSLSLEEHFRELEDPRTDDWRKKHDLLEIIVIAICTVLCGAQSLSRYGRLWQWENRVV